MIQNDNLLTIESLADLAAAHQPPCLSLYLTTHWHRPENQQDPIRFRSLVKELEASDRELAGRLDASACEIEIAPLGNPQVDDLLDDLGELVTKRGGQVSVIPVERMPTKSGLAATYRY